jgi:hypothetical protein
VQAAVQSANGLSLRVVLAYDKDSQGLQITYDCLMGTQILEADLGVMILG